MADTRFYFSAAHEAFPPSDLVLQAVEAERAGFDGIACSDHFQPWWEPGESGHAWVWLGAAAQATDRVPIGSAVTAPVHRYHPAIVAQAFATLEEMNPGRAFLGIGSGESLNETPMGIEWPPVGEQLDRMEEALQVIDALFDGKRVSHDGHFRTRNAYLHTRPERRPPIYVSAFGERAAKIAGQLGDGLWTLADPETTPRLIEVYRGAAEDAGREPGEVLLHVGFSWAGDDAGALAGADVWRATMIGEYYVEDWHEPAKMLEHAQQQVSDEQVRESFIVSADPSEHADRIREIERLGATIVVCMNVSGRDPHGAIETYGRKVIPSLRGARVG